MAQRSMQDAIIVKRKIHMIGNAHLDPVWLWQWQEGFAEVKATFRSALDRMKEFSGFVFTCACAAYYKWVEENCPEMFEEIRERVKEGRWVITGGWWIQPDCNIPSGESFARHGLYSQRYFKEKFGVMAKVGYNVDSFGHNGMLPQILKKSGMDYYVFMRPDEREREYPGNLFWWEGMDGSRIMAYRIPFYYNSWIAEGRDTTLDNIANAEKLSEEQGIDMMSFYGVGNHGGGPTRANILAIKQLQEESDRVSLVFSSPDEYFKEMAIQDSELPVVRDDLQHTASGCYSTHAKTKKNNRKAEHRLASAEKFLSAAHYLLGFDYSRTEIRDAWEKVLFNQFHDIMGGCSIREAYDDAEEFYGKALTIGAEALNAAVQKLSWAIDTMGGHEMYVSKDKDGKLWDMGESGAPLVVFNPLSWEVTTPVQVGSAVKGITDEAGIAVEIQRVRASRTNGGDKWDTLFTGKIPAMGYRVYRLFKDKELEIPEDNALTASSEGVMENEYIRLEFEAHTGNIRRMYDKINKMEVLSGFGAVPIVIDEFDSDTWAHGIFEFRRETGRFSDAVIRLVEDGTLRAKLRITSKYCDSLLRQDYMLYRDKPDIEVKVKLDWREKHKMLKLSFPVNVSEPSAVYEIPYGFIERPVNGEEEPGQQWLDVSGRQTGAGVYGLSLLNDGRYGFDVKGNDMRMTVVRSPIFADHFGERDELCEFMEQGIHEFTYVLVPHAGDWREAGIVKKAYELNVPPVKVNETYHKGCLPLRSEGFRIDAQNVIVSAFKQAEDGNGYILRCYEISGNSVETEIELPLLKRKWKASFGRSELKTFYIPYETEADIYETNLLEMV